MRFRAEEIVRRDPSRGHALLGELALRERDFPAAEKELRLAIELAASDEVRTDARRQLEVLHEKAGRPSH